MSLSEILLKHRVSAEFLPEFYGVLRRREVPVDESSKWGITFR